MMYFPTICSMSLLIYTKKEVCYVRTFICKMIPFIVVVGLYPSPFRKGTKHKVIVLRERKETEESKKRVNINAFKTLPPTYRVGETKEKLYPSGLTFLHKTRQESDLSELLFPVRTSIDYLFSTFSHFFFTGEKPPLFFRRRKSLVSLSTTFMFTSLNVFLLSLF